MSEIKSGSENRFAPENAGNDSESEIKSDFIFTPARELTPREITAELDAHIVGQHDAKRAVAIAVRNRWRRRQLPEALREEISPKNILMIGPTGVGKTEMARRLARLTNAPFVKVEATKYTEVGYYGRDVESMIRDLVENAVGIVRNSELEKVKTEAELRVEERLLDILASFSDVPGAPQNSGTRKTSGISESFGKNSSEKPGENADENSDESADENADVSEELQKKDAYSLSGALKIPDDRTPEDFSAMKTVLEEALPDEIKNAIQNAFGGKIPIEVEVRKITHESERDKSGGETVKKTDEESFRESFENSDGTPRMERQEPSQERQKKAQREKLREQLRAGLLEEREIEIPTQRKSMPPFMMMNITGGDSMESGLSEVLDQMLPKKTVRRKFPVRDARKILLEKECDALINEEKVQAAAIQLAESSGIIFLDEIDKIVASNSQHGADVSRQGVQRDLLPIVEGTTIQTRYGYIRTDYILFIAAGAFHQNKPGDLMPELQGRFPIRVELQDLNQEDFRRILTEPKNSLLRQYEALLETEGVHVTFQKDAVEELAAYAWKVNQTSQNIGARRLYTIMERLLEDLSFNASELKKKTVKIDAAYVRERLEGVTQDEDLSRFIL